MGKSQMAPLISLLRKGYSWSMLAFAFLSGSKDEEKK